MSSHQSTLIVPEDISHLHSHTSGPTNLHSIRLMLPKHPFDHDIAWVKQLQPRQHSSNKYLSFGSLVCRATATPVWISYFALPAQCSECGQDAGPRYWAWGSEGGRDIGPWAQSKDQMLGTVLSVAWMLGTVLRARPGCWGRATLLGTQFLCLVKQFPLLPPLIVWQWADGSYVYFPKIEFSYVALEIVTVSLTLPRIQQTPTTVMALTSRQHALPFGTFVHSSSYFVSTSKFYFSSCYTACPLPSFPIAAWVRGDRCLRTRKIISRTPSNWKESLSCDQSSYFLDCF